MKEIVLDDKQPMSFRLSDKARFLLRALSKEEGMGMTAVIESLIRQAAQKHNIKFIVEKDNE